MNVQDLEQLQDLKPCHVVLAMAMVRSDQDKVFLLFSRLVQIVEVKVK